MKNKQFLNLEIDITDLLNQVPNADLISEIKRRNINCENKGNEIEDLYYKIIKLFPENLIKEHKKNDWLKELDKLIRIDKKQSSEIYEIVKKAREHKFWSKNFLSILKLRKKNKDGIKYFTVFEHLFLKKEIAKKSKYAINNEIKKSKNRLNF